MSRRKVSIAAAYFERLYASNPDPWGFVTSSYEARKYAATLAALPRRRFGVGLELGCSIGVLTCQLASRCDKFLAIDGAETALSQARARCPNVIFQRAMIPAEWPAGKFDLIVFSEVLYYLSIADIRATARRAMEALRYGGSIVLVHYLGLTDYPATGDAAAKAFIMATALRPALQIREFAYRIDRLDR